VLFVTPLSLLWASGRAVYPPIDPESGGATGHSLLASSLGIIGVFGLLPWLLRLKCLGVMRFWRCVYVGLYVASWCAWALLEHGNASNTQIGQILGLCVLLLWVPVLRSYYNAFTWPMGMTMWLRAFLFWWAFLTVSGCITFMPGVLDVMKFTNGLVAHAHLAMAGMIGAFNMLILSSLGHSEPTDPWTDVRGYWLWQIGTLLYVLAMLVQGVREGLDPSVLFGSNTMTSVLYALRLLAGILMIWATLRWVFLVDGVRREKSNTTLNGVETLKYEA
jgi:cytochrome c oxidase cbb3-type subunit 1